MSQKYGRTTYAYKGYRKLDRSGVRAGYQPDFEGANPGDVESLRKYGFRYGFRKSELIQAIYHNLYCGNLYYHRSHWMTRCRRLFRPGRVQASRTIIPYEKRYLPIPCPATPEQAKSLRVVAEGLGMNYRTFWSTLADAFENDGIWLMESKWFFCQDYLLDKDTQGNTVVQLRRKDD